MKSLTEIYTPLIKNLQGLNQEIKQKLSSIPYSTADQLEDLERWLVEVRRMAQDLESVSLVISHHLQLLDMQLKERLKEVSSKD